MPRFASRQMGTGVTETFVRELDTFGGPGLDLPADRVLPPIEDAGEGTTAEDGD